MTRRMDQGYQGEPQRIELPQGQYVNASDPYQIGTSGIETEKQGTYAHHDVDGGIDDIPLRQTNILPTEVADAGPRDDTVDMLDTGAHATDLDRRYHARDEDESLFNSGAVGNIVEGGVLDTTKRQSRGWEVREYDLPAPEIMECHTLQVTKGNGMEDIMYV